MPSLFKTANSKGNWKIKIKIKKLNKTKLINLLILHKFSIIPLESPAKKYIAKAPIRRLMKDEGAKLVAESAVDLLINKLEKTAMDVTKAAIKLVKADKRKRLTAPDIQMAAR